MLGTRLQDEQNWRPTNAQKANADMLTDAMADMKPLELFAAIEAHLEARPDIAAFALEQFGNRIGRLSWGRARDEVTS